MKFKSRFPLIIATALLFLLGGGEKLRASVGDHLYFNLSVSLPRGIYQRVDKEILELGDLALFQVPPDYSIRLGEREWLPPGRPLLKPVAAASGTSFCLEEENLTLHGREYRKFKTDYLGEKIPTKKGCFQLSETEFLALSNYSNRSFDSRYFGTLQKSSVLGILKPVFVF